MKDAPLKHTPIEDLFGITIGSFLIAAGIQLLHSGNILTGGTAGLGLLIATHLNTSVSLMYPVVSAPFLLLAIWRKGWFFTLRTTINIIYVSVLVEVFTKYLTIEVHSKLVASLLANILFSMGLLALFRHNSSVGGFGIVALIAQEQFKFKAGYAQLILDLLVMAIALTTYSLSEVLISIVGVILLNVALALNHRSDRYLGFSKDL